MKWFLDVIVAAAVLASLLFLLGYLITLPIDEGGEVSRLATAGIMRSADV